MGLWEVWTSFLHSPMVMMIYKLKLPLTILFAQLFLLFVRSVCIAYFFRYEYGFKFNESAIQKSLYTIIAIICKTWCEISLTIFFIPYYITCVHVCTFCKYFRLLWAKKLTIYSFYFYVTVTFISQNNIKTSNHCFSNDFWLTCTCAVSNKLVNIWIWTSEYQIFTWNWFLS